MQAACSLRKRKCLPFFAKDTPASSSPPIPFRFQNDTSPCLSIFPGLHFLVSKVVPVSAQKSSPSISSFGHLHPGESGPAQRPLLPQTYSLLPYLLSPPSTALPKVTSDIPSANAVTFSQPSSHLTFLTVSHHGPSPVCLFGKSIFASYSPSLSLLFFLFFVLLVSLLPLLP